MEEHDDYWSADLALGEGSFYGESCTIRARLREEHERYSRTEGRELISLTHPRGIRRYYQVRAYILLPDLSLTVQLAADPEPRSAAGEVRSAQWTGMRHETIGSAQAWYYPSDRKLILWEALLEPRHRRPDPAADLNLLALWAGLERLLLERCPDAEQLVTPHDEPEYEQAAWQAFLRRLGYRPLNARTWSRWPHERSSSKLR